MVEFYYTTWKGSAHYEVWKNGGQRPPPRAPLPAIKSAPRVTVVISDDDDASVPASLASQVPPPSPSPSSSPAPSSPLPVRPLPLPSSTSVFSLTAIVEAFPHLMEGAGTSTVVPSSTASDESITERLQPDPTALPSKESGEEGPMMEGFVEAEAAEEELGVDEQQQRRRHEEEQFLADDEAMDFEVEEPSSLEVS